MKYQKRPEIVFNIFVGGPKKYTDAKKFIKNELSFIKNELNKKNIFHEFKIIPTTRKEREIPPEDQKKLNELAEESDIMFMFFDVDYIGTEVDKRIELPIDVKNNLNFFLKDSGLSLTNSLLEIIYAATKRPHKRIYIFFNKDNIENISSVKVLYHLFKEKKQLGRIYLDTYSNFNLNELNIKEIINEIVEEQEKVFDDILSSTSPTVFPKKNGHSIYEKMTDLLAESRRLLSFHFKKNLSSSRLFEVENKNDIKKLSPRDKFSLILKTRLLENKKGGKKLKFSRIAAITTLEKLFFALKEINLLKETDTINLIYFPYKKLRSKSDDNSSNEDYFEQANIVLFGENEDDYSFNHAVWGLFDNENSKNNRDDGRFSKAILYNNKLNDCPFSSYAIATREKLEKVSPLYVSFMEVSYDEETTYQDEIRGMHCANFYVLLNLLIKLEFSNRVIEDDTTIGNYEIDGKPIDYTLKTIKNEICNLCEFLSINKKYFPRRLEMSDLFKEIYEKILDKRATIPCGKYECPLKNK